MAGLIPHDIVIDPDWLPHTYDADGSNLLFVNVPHDKRSELMFLSDEHFAGNFEKIRLSVAAVAAEMQVARSAPLHFIFHSSFCCSTLLARALAIPGTSTALREPDVLINLANRLIRSDDQANRQRLDLVLRLLQRPPADGGSVIVKPTNFANRIADVVLASRPEVNAVLLYSDVETFLRSLLKRGMFGRIVGRKLFAQLRGWSPLGAPFSDAELFEQTDVQIAALAWLMQIHHFDTLSRAFGPERVTVIDAATLLADPKTAITKAQGLFGLGLGEDEIDAIIAGPAFTRHSKFSERAYDLQARAKDHEETNAANAEELGMVSQWIAAVAAQVGAPLRPRG